MERVMSGFEVGATVTWNWVQGTASGKVRERFVGKVSRTIKGTEVTRNASKAEPAYLIEQDDGAEVLKGHSESKKAS